MQLVDILTRCSSHRQVVPQLLSHPQRFFVVSVIILLADIMHITALYYSSRGIVWLILSCWGLSQLRLHTDSEFECMSSSLATEAHSLKMVLHQDRCWSVHLQPPIPWEVYTLWPRRSPCPCFCGCF